MSLHLDRGIFENGIRPRLAKFAVLFHYPNQILDSINTIIRQWNVKKKEQHYYMDFNVLGMNVLGHRYKPKLDNCIHNWRNYDPIMQEKHIRKVGCKAPYQNTVHDFPICDSREKMKQTLYPIETGHISPCRTIEKIDYQYIETDSVDLPLMQQFHLHPIHGKYWKQWFGVTYRFLSDKFTIKINKKEMDFESLVGYIGGYVGLFAGFAFCRCK